MKLETRALVPAELGATWDLLMDLPRASACVPGLQELVPDGEGVFRATLQARVGPISLKFSGTIQILEQDRGKGEAQFRIEGADRRVGGSFKADMTMRLTSGAPGQTELFIATDTTFMGKLGEFGQPIIRRKAGATIEEFARNLAQELNATQT